MMSFKSKSKIVTKISKAVAVVALLAASLASSFESAAAQTSQAGALVGGLGTVVFNYIAMPSGSLLVGQGSAVNPIAASVGGDCTMNAAAQFTCTKTNGAALGTVVTANTGTSGSNVPLMSTANAWSAAQTFTAHQIAGATSPTPSACGTSPSIIGDDKDGVVTMGTTATGCVITFNSPYVLAPLCTVSWQATPLASQSYTVSASAITTVQTSASNNKLNYHCTAQSGG